MRKDFVAAWGKRPVADVTRRGRSAGYPGGQTAWGPSVCSKSVGLSSRFFDWAIDQHAYAIKANPCTGLKPARIVGKRKHVIGF